MAINDDISKGLKLLEIVRDFIHEEKIICPESIYQMDNVILGAPEFIENCCCVVGFYRDKEDL